MQKVYLKVLNKLIEDTLSREHFQGCHKHRIIPGYMGGQYIEDNVIFVTQREHSLIHFLRWKIFKDSRDKRAHKMIGVGPSGLSYQDRVDHGNVCVDNKLGIHGASAETKAEWRAKGHVTQKQDLITTGVKNWYYWSTKEGRKERSGLGGKASYGTNQGFLNQQCSFKDKNLATAAGQKSAKKPVTDGNGVIRKFHTEAERDAFLKQNLTWRRGCPSKKEKSALEK